MNDSRVSSCQLECARQPPPRQTFVSRSGRGRISLILNALWHLFVGGSRRHVTADIVLTPQNRTGRDGFSRQKSARKRPLVHFLGTGLLTGCGHFLLTVSPTCEPVVFRRMSKICSRLTYQFTPSARMYPTR